MLDIVYVLGIIALFVLVGLIGRAVERLGPRSSPAAQRGATGGGER